MRFLVLVVIGIVAILLLGAAMPARIVKQYEDGALLRLSRVIDERAPGFRLIIPFVNVLLPDGCRD